MPSSDSRVVRLRKDAPDVRMGISFQKDSSPMHIGEGSEAHKRGVLPPVIRAVNPAGLAAAAGLHVGDMVLTINGKEVISNLNAAAMLREAQGDIKIVVRSVMPPPDASASAAPPPNSAAEAVPPLALDPQPSPPGAHGAGEADTAAGSFTARMFGQATKLFEETSKQMMQMGLTARAGSQSSRAQPGGGLTAMFFAPKGPDKNAAATRLQAAVRAHRARKVLQTHKWAATVVQAAARGQGARREAEQRRRTQAAVRIQANYRGHLDRTYVDIQRTERAKLQKRPSWFGGGERIKRVMSFNRKKREGQQPQKAGASPAARSNGHGPSPVQPAQAGIGRKLSFGRKGKRAGADDAPSPAPAPGGPAAAGGGSGIVKRTLSFGKKK